MKSFNGVDLEVGMKVVVLQTPIIHDHKFVMAEVVKINAKTVSVEGWFDEKYVRGLTKMTVNRYGHQVIVLPD